ncbi:MAG: CAP domain-containing protein [Pseudolabrys sp.]|nr:CAP domain-containing protein [Pseudolabrys sp.]
MRALLIAAVLAGAASPAMTSQALALDLNSFRAENKLPPLSVSATLAGAADGHARDMARRDSLDHDGFAARAKLSGGTAAENVSYGCDNMDCAIKQWAKSSGHRKNMLMKGVSAYGIASAVSESGRKYWAMVLGN